MIPTIPNASRALRFPNASRALRFPNVSRALRSNYTIRTMVSILQFPQNSKLGRPASSDTIFIHLPPPRIPLFTLFSKMADESIYYMFSRRIPHLRESKICACHFDVITKLTFHSPELQQRDRLIDSQIYLKVLDCREVRVVVRGSGHPCASAALLLASLLRVSVTRNLRYRRAPNFPSQTPTGSPWSSISTPSNLHTYSTHSTSHHATSHHPLETRSPSTSSSRSVFNQSQCSPYNSLSSSSV